MPSQEVENVDAITSVEDANAAVIDSAPEKKESGMSKMKLYRRRFMRNKLAVFGLVIFFFLVLLAIFGKYIARYDYTWGDFYNLSAPPSAEHWWGTDEGGHDIFAQAVHGLGRSLTIAVTVSISTTIISAFVGATAAFLGGWGERIILAIIHFLLVIPSFLLIALIVSGSGGDWKVLIVVLIAFGWMYSSRVIWSLAISIREREFVKAARFMGVPTMKIVARHMIPNIGSLLVINGALGVVSAVMSETGLSFLGLGVKVPDVSLGTLLSAGAGSVRSAEWVFWFPAGILTLLTVSMAFIADGLRDALDPNSSAGGRA